MTCILPDINMAIKQKKYQVGEVCSTHGVDEKRRKKIGRKNCSEETT
jgi:hypothetical protein